MLDRLRNFRKNKFQVHLLVFAIMMIVPWLLYLAAQVGDGALLWPLIGVIVAASGLVLVTK